MQIILPWPQVVHVIELPSADFGNSRRPLTQVNNLRALDGTRYTYVNDTNLETLTFNFKMTRMKALHILDLYKLYSDKKWKITDDNGTSFVGFIKNNPVTLTMSSRGTYCPADSVGSHDNVDFVINFEGEEV